MPNNIKLIATDIDGTLLDRHGKISEYTKEVFKTAKAMGIHTVIATGRTLSALPEVIKAMDCFEYVVTCNGTTIYHMPDAGKVYENMMSPELVRGITDIFKQYDFPVEVFLDGKAYTTRAYYENACILNIPEHMKHYVQTTRLPQDDIYAFIDENIERIEAMDMVIDDMALKMEIRKGVEALPDIYVTSSVSHYIECSSGSACKGEALKELGRILGISPQNMMTFGDGENDLEMIEIAGIGVAVENGYDLLKRAADQIAPSNNCDGVAKTIAKVIGI